MTLLTACAVAYVNYGRWCADCPRPHCANAVKLEPHQATFHCGGPDGCQLMAEIEWPVDADEIWEALAERPVPATRNWAPVGHRQALVTGFPSGQTVAQLRDETHEHEEH